MPTPKTPKDLFSALRTCGDADLFCRLRQIDAFGLAGVKMSLLTYPSRHSPKDPGPSWGVIKEVMDVLFKILGKVADGAFKPYIKAFKLIYKPHFKVLEMMDSTFQRYWTNIEFLLWSLETLQELRSRIENYLELTGEFSAQKLILSLSQMSQEESNRVLSKTRLSAADLVTVDASLLSDIQILLEIISKGLQQASQLRAADSTTDNIALGTLFTNIQWLELGYDNFPAVVNRLIDHLKSWNINGESYGDFQDLKKKSLELGSQFKNATDWVTSKQRFGR